MTTTWPMMPARRGLRLIDQDAVDHAQQRAGQHRHCHHEPVLRRRRDAGPRTICTASGPSITQTMKLMSK